MATTTLRRLWQNEYVKTAIMIVILVALVFGFWYALKFVLNTEYPVFVVASGSMCEPYGMRCDGWSHVFERTLHVGDLIIVQGVDPSDINADAKPYGDIIVFHKPKLSEGSADELIVHRATDAEINSNTGLIYFQTWGDANSGSDSFTDYRGLNYTWKGMVSEKLLVGKVVLRIPWFGHISLLMHNSSGVYIIIILLIILVIVEFVFPILTKKEDEQERNVAKVEPNPET